VQFEERRLCVTPAPAAAIRGKAPSQHLDCFYIGGEWVRPSSSDRIDVIMPSTEELYFTVAEAREADVNRAVAAARQAFDHGPWPHLSVAERADYLRRISEEIHRRSESLGALWTGETGALYTLASAAFASGQDEFARHADLAANFPFVERRTPAGGGDTGLLVREPVGVVGAIIPWNGPFFSIGVKCAPALLAGCTIVLKSSPEAPGDGYIMAEIAEAVGLPPGVFNVLTADREVSEVLVRHPDVDKITFTGSTAAGRRIGALCGERVARCTLELGGKSPGLILNDYDVETAARTIAAVAPMMTGQVCSALTRIIVPRDRHDDFVEALAAAMSAVKVGDPFDPENAMGPLAMARQRERVEGYIAKGKAEGARLATGGSRPKHLDRGFYIEPTVFAEVNNSMVIAREEIFGPVLSVIPAADEEQAIAIANDTPYGLNASVFTNDVERAYRVARRIRAGTVGHNIWRTDFSIAFGGFKQSGIGREGGSEGLHNFLEPKTVILEGKLESLD
jgi:acyl-CoA reductase-like NAD-dependent aldehyde dehydrogenase